MSVVKYQVFISSTYEDLKDERNEVIKVVLEMGHIPVGMEMFSAADEEQWKLIARQIDQSDYYIVLIAHRYGSETAEGLSYTEKEYDYAVSQGVPTLGFVIKEGAKWPAERVDKTRKKIKALDAFKTKVKGKPVDFWSSGDDLRGKVAIALMKAVNTSPRPGWVRASDAAGPGVLAEISRLSAENASLREELGLAKEEHETKKLAELRKVLETLERVIVEIPVWKVEASGWSHEAKLSMKDVMNIVAPELIVEANIEFLAAVLAINCAPTGAQLREVWPMPSNALRSILVDLEALGLLSPSKRRHPVADKNEYWTLTENGRDLLKLIRRGALETGTPGSTRSPLP